MFNSANFNERSLIIPHNVFKPMILNLFIKTHDDLMSKIVIEFDPIEIASSLIY